MNGPDNLLKYLTVPAIACLFLSFNPHPASADDQVVLPYDWVIQVDTIRLKRQFEYSGSTLNPIEKLEVSWHPVDKKDDVKKYESMWFHDGKAVGMEKVRKLDIEKGEGVAIEVKHKESNATEAEKKAVANAIIRLTLDAYLNKNTVAAVKVPKESFSGISNRIQEFGFHIAEEKAGDSQVQYTSDMTVTLISVPEGEKQTLIR
ncbi:MAG: hypothetical protein IT343_00740 [Candidatus Melainabacteria bacterium]|jgi:hypothetical protein|nr:hypothetical protein [Candidatus Melainabacteria bacterium]